MKENERCVWKTWGIQVQVHLGSQMWRQKIVAAIPYNSATGCKGTIESNVLRSCWESKDFIPCQEHFVVLSLDEL